MPFASLRELSVLVNIGVGQLSDFHTLNRIATNAAGAEVGLLHLGPVQDGSLQLRPTQVRFRAEVPAVWCCSAL